MTVATIQGRTPVLQLGDRVQFDSPHPYAKTLVLHGEVVSLMDPGHVTLWVEELSCHLDVPYGEVRRV